MVVAMASGDGFAPHKGAMDTAARAAETMWWWDPSPVGTDRATNGAAPTKKSKKDPGGADGTWRTRDELVQAGSGTKAPTPAKDRARWTPWDQLIDTSEAPYLGRATASATTQRAPRVQRGENSGKSR